MTDACVMATVETTEQEAVTEKLTHLPLNHMRVLLAVVKATEPAPGATAGPVTTAQVQASMADSDAPTPLQLSDRAVRDLLADLETMGLVETWIEPRGRGRRVKQIEPTFDPLWALEALPAYAERSEHLDVSTDDEDA